MKVDYDSVRAVNPAIIYASISGFGQDGPYAERGGVDQIAQGLGGMMSITGSPESGPMRAGVAISDVTAARRSGSCLTLSASSCSRSAEADAWSRNATADFRASLSAACYVRAPSRWSS